MNLLNVLSSAMCCERRSSSVPRDIQLNLTVIGEIKILPHASLSRKLSSSHQIFMISHFDFISVQRRRSRPCVTVSTNEHEIESITAAIRVINCIRTMIHHHKLSSILPTHRCYIAVCFIYLRDEINCKLRCIKKKRSAKNCLLIFSAKLFLFAIFCSLHKFMSFFPMRESLLV